MGQPSIGRASAPTLLVVGAATRDVDRADARGWRLGGTVAYASLAAARMGVPVRALMGVDAVTAAAEELDVLRAAGVELRIVELTRGPMFENRETGSGRVQFAHRASDTMPADVLPEDWRAARTVLLAAVAGELGDEWARAFPSGSYVALTWQGVLRRLVPGRAVERLEPSVTPLVARADAIFVSAEDVRADVPLDTLMREGQHLVLTRGDRGAIALARASGRLRGRAVRGLALTDPVDATGAGDVFAASWLAARLLAPHAPDDRHLLVASTMAALSVGTRSIAELPGSHELCEALLRQRTAQAG